MFYNIHNIVGIKSDIELYELGYFKADKINLVDIIVGKTDSNIVFKDLLSKVSINDGKAVKLGVNMLLKKSRHVLYVNLFEPLLRLVLLSKGFVLLHLAGIARNEEGILISAPPDTGKTTLVLRCLQTNEFALLSDDMIITDGETILSFPKPFTISSHTLQALFGQKPSIFFKIRSKVHSRGGRKILKSLGSTQLPVLTINALAQIIFKPPKLFPEIELARVAKPKSIFFISRDGNFEREVSEEEAVKLIDRNTREAYETPPYHQIFPGLRVKGKAYNELMQKEREITLRLLRNIRTRQIVGRCDYSWHNYILENI